LSRQDTKSARISQRSSPRFIVFRIVYNLGLNQNSRHWRIHYVPLTGQLLIAEVEAIRFGKIFGYQYVFLERK
jgi:hypothetical protein